MIRLRVSIRRAALFLLLGACVTVAVAYALAATSDLTQGVIASASGWTGQENWTVNRWDRIGGVRLVSVREMGRNWGAYQATGAPDTPTGGDQVTAWASASADGSKEWLLLEYEQAVVPQAVHVYEMCQTGALEAITVFDEAGTERAFWKGVDPLGTGKNMGLAKIAAPAGFDVSTRKVKLYIDSPKVSSWNEIDAVGLVSAADGSVQWAVAAFASSEYGASTSLLTAATSGGPGTLAPPWTGLHEPLTPLDGRPRRRREERMVEARGFPFLALRAERVIDATPAVTPTVVQGYGRPGQPAAPPSSGSLAGFTFTRLSIPTAATGAPSDPLLPARPVWGGFLANTAIYAVALAAGYWLLAAPRRFFREASRMRRGCCVACGYDVRYDFVGGCPECGWNRGERAAAEGAG